MTQLKRITKERKNHTRGTDRIAIRRYKKRWPDAQKSSDEEDMYDHIDFWHVRNGDKFGVDLKGNKCADQIWIEFQNVNGDKGWIHGKARWIIFEIPEAGGFACVPREDLLSWCRNNVSKEMVKDRRNAYKKLYSRDAWQAYDGKAQRDLITFVTINDLKEVKGYTFTNYSNQFPHPVTKVMTEFES